jgi:hypothetical protein
VSRFLAGLLLALGVIVWALFIGVGCSPSAGTAREDASADASTARWIVSTLASSSSHSFFGVIANQHGLYFFDNYAIATLPFAGGVPSNVVPGATDTSPDTSSLVSDADHLYWTDPLRSALLTGAEETVLLPEKGSPQPFQAIAVDESNIYWLLTNTGTDVGPQPLIAAIGRVPKQGGVIVTLKSDESKLYGGLAIDQANVYWLSAPLYATRPCSLVRMAKTGGAVATLATTSGQLDGNVAVSDGYVYWAAGNSVQRVPAGGGSPERLATVGRDGALTIVDSGVMYLFEISPTGATLLTMSAAGGPVTSIATTRGYVAGWWVYDGSVYWTRSGEERGGGELLRASREQ